MMQLIYVNDAPEAIAWVEKINGRLEEIRAIWEAFLAEIQAKYPMPDGSPRYLAVADNLVMGFRRAIGEETIPGWQFNGAVNAWVPDILTDDGGTWQTKIDALPRNDVVVDFTEIGMPSSAHIHMPNGLILNLAPMIQLSDEHDKVFAVWSHRDPREGLGKALVEMERTTGFHWEEMPRSAWYARLERLEAEAEAAEEAARAEFEDVIRGLDDIDFTTAGDTSAGTGEL